MSKQAEEVGWLRIGQAIEDLYLKEKGDTWTWSEEQNTIWLKCGFVFPNPADHAVNE